MIFPGRGMPEKSVQEPSDERSETRNHTAANSTPPGFRMRRALAKRLHAILMLQMR